MKMPCWHPSVRTISADTKSKIAMAAAGSRHSCQIGKRISRKSGFIGIFLSMF